MTPNGDRPFDQAWILIAWIQSSFEVDEWREVSRRDQQLDNGMRTAAIRRLGEAMHCHPQSRALSALSVAARKAAHDANLEASSRLERVLSRRRSRMTPEARDAAGRAASHAVLSLALAPQLQAVDVVLLTSAVLGTLRTVVERPLTGSAEHAPR